VATSASPETPDGFVKSFEKMHPTLKMKLLTFAGHATRETGDGFI
jgi:hypothetical protein